MAYLKPDQLEDVIFMPQPRARCADQATLDTSRYFMQFAPPTQASRDAFDPLLPRRFRNVAADLRQAGMTDASIRHVAYVLKHLVRESLKIENRLLAAHDVYRERDVRADMNKPLAVKVTTGNPQVPVYLVPFVRSRFRDVAGTLYEKKPEMFAVSHRPQEGNWLTRLVESLSP